MPWQGTHRRVVATGMVYAALEPTTAAASQPSQCDKNADAKRLESTCI